MSFLAITFGLIAWNTGLFDKQVEIIQCDAETVVEWKKAPYFYQNGHYFTAGELQSNEKHRSGEYSIKIPKNKEFAMSITLPKIGENTKIKASVWRYSTTNTEGDLVLNIPGGKFWKKANPVKGSREKGWEKLEMFITIPAHLANYTVYIYLWNNRKEELFFDDLEIGIAKDHTG